MLAEPAALIRKAVTIAETAPETVALVSGVFTRASAEAFLSSRTKAK
jgi:hypothetical protein